MAKRPKLFQYVEQHVPTGPGYIHRGLVVHVLESQFTIATEDGGRHMCLFREDWRTVPVKREEKQQYSVSAPSVWRDHQSRTCIVLEAEDDTVSFIPMGVDDAFDVQVLGTKPFVNFYLEPIDYPVARAARLFVEFARNTGATDEAINALSKFTTITEEEMEMAKKSAQTKEKAEPKAKTAAKPRAKSAVAEAAEKKPRESAAQLYRDLIRQGGKSCAQIVAQVSRKFPDSKASDTYVKWYYNDLVKKGENVEMPKGLPEGKRGRKKKEEA